MSYNDVYPPLGPADWTPYARKIADSGVKGMVFYGDAANLAKLEQALVDIGYHLDWFDAGNNGYSQGFIKTAAGALDEIKNYSPPFVYPVEDAAHNPATQQLVDILEQRVPDAVLTGSMVNAWSAWLIFAKAAGECGSQLSRRCLLEKARSFKDWDGGGLTPAIDLGNPTSTRMCMSPVEATSEGSSTRRLRPGRREVPVRGPARAHDRDPTGGDARQRRPQHERRQVVIVTDHRKEPQWRTQR